jgi:GNAT superfamily N-acetyltransferase
MQDIESIEIGLFRQEQLESLADLLHEMSGHYNGPNASARNAVRANLVENILGSNSDVRLVVASEGMRVVGVAAVALLHPAPKETGQLFMKELYVVADKRGSAVGRALMQWVARYALQNNCSRFDWTAESTNSGALRFYRALGARHVTEKVYFRLDGE